MESFRLTEKINFLGQRDLPSVSGDYLGVVYDRLTTVTRGQDEVRHREWSGGKDGKGGVTLRMGLHDRYVKLTLPMIFLHPRRK